jgi:hypothetical protein
MTFRIGAAALTMTVVDLDVGTTPMGLMIGQYKDVQVVAERVSWGAKRLRRLTVRCRNVHIRPGLTSTLVAAPIEIEAVLGHEDLADWTNERLRHLSLRIGTDSIARVAIARHHQMGYVEVTPSLDGSAIRMVPTGLFVLGRRWALRRLPAPRLAPKGLPANLSLRAVEVGPEELSIHATVDEWREPLSLARLGKLAGRLRAAKGSVDVPLAETE